ncbi:MAG: PDZ domain-containing protein [Acidobacteriota bacterium]|nr:PDZ domain-containing protein [Acidobacteriota bacterium]
MVRFILNLPGIRSLHERQLLFPVVVIVVVAVVLVDGAIDRTEQVERDTSSPSSTTLVPQTPSPPRPVLRGDLEKTPLTYVADYWSQLSASVGAKLVGIGRTQVSGVVFESGLAVTTVAGADTLEVERARMLLAREAVAVAESSVSEERSDYPSVRAIDRVSGLAVVEIESSYEPFTAADVSQIPSGSYVGAVSLEQAGRPVIAPGYLVSLQRELEPGRRENDLRTSLLPPRRGVSAVVDLDGALVGVMYGSPNGPRSLTVGSLRRVIDSMAQVEPCRAIAVSRIDDQALPLLGVDRGLLVANVVEEAFVPEPSLQSGDVLLDWAGEPITTVDNFIERYDAAGAGELVRYRVLRGRRRVDGGTVLPDTECRASRPISIRLVSLGIILSWSEGTSPSSDGWIVDIIADGGYADAAGIAEGDVISAINGVSLDNVEQRSILERLSLDDGPQIVTLRREGQSRLVVIRDRE